jgi:hypothetical protein
MLVSKLIAHGAHLGVNFGESASNALTKFLDEPEFVTQMLAALHRYRQPIGMG